MWYNSHTLLETLPDHLSTYLTQSFTQFSLSLLLSVFFNNSTTLWLSSAAAHTYYLCTTYLWAYRHYIQISTRVTYIHWSEHLVSSLTQNFQGLRHRCCHLAPLSHPHNNGHFTILFIVTLVYFPHFVWSDGQISSTPCCKPHPLFVHFVSLSLSNGL